jgi:hypothetical protein
MGLRSFGPVARNLTTTQIADIITKYGPTGTIEPNAIRLGTMLYDVTLNKLMIFTGTTFVVAGTQS